MVPGNMETLGAAFVCLMILFCVVRFVWDIAGPRRSAPPRMSVEVCGNVVEIGIAHPDGPLLIQVVKNTIVAWETNCSQEVTILCANGTRYVGSGISHEKGKKIRQQLGWEN
jgi:hypothetical protein